MTKDPHQFIQEGGDWNELKNNALSIESFGKLHPIEYADFLKRNPLK